MKLTGGCTVHENSDFSPDIRQKIFSPYCAEKPQQLVYGDPSIDRHSFKSAIYFLQVVSLKPRVCWQAGWRSMLYTIFTEITDGLKEALKKCQVEKILN